jgi:hypothetical protein
MTADDLRLSLQERLQKAVELEWSTIPPYLTAWYSLHPQQNGDSAAILRSVFTEEMLHMVLAANVLSAIGGKIRLGERNLPRYPLQMEFRGQAFGDRKFDLHLAPFSQAALETFLQIELPDPPASAQAKLLAESVVPAFTVGGFYRGIREDLVQLSRMLKEDEVFSGALKGQLTEDYYWSAGGSPIVVCDLASATHALQTITEQGEGSGDTINNADDTYFGQPAEVAHYFRFREILAGRHYAPSDRPSAPPSGQPFAVDFDAVYPIKTDCRSEDLAGEPELARLNDQFNTSYSLMLAQLEEGLNGNPKALYYAIMDGMHSLTPLARSMMQIPLPNVSGKTGAPTFAWRQPLLG